MILFNTTSCFDCPRQSSSGRAMAHKKSEKWTGFSLQTLGKKLLYNNNNNNCYYYYYSENGIRSDLKLIHRLYLNITYILN